MTLQTFKQRVALDTEFRRELWHQAQAGTLPPRYEAWIWETIYGPVDPRAKRDITMAAAVKLNLADPIDVHPDTMTDITILAWLLRCKVARRLLHDKFRKRKYQRLIRSLDVAFAGEPMGLRR